MNPREADTANTASTFRDNETAQDAPATKNEPQPVEPQKRDENFAIGRQQSDDDKSLAVPKPAPPPVDLAAARKAPEGSDEGLARISSTERSADAKTKAKGGGPASRAGENNYVIDGVENKAPQAGARRGAPESRRARSNPANTDEAGSEKTVSALKDERAKEEGAGEKRSVGGRQFRRQGGAWVDTAYNSSRAAINVHRGSEQYRALVADEPGIRHIADQLDGTVILVWKNRAYRIY
jgi:hypothetical protein